MTDCEHKIERFEQEVGPSSNSDVNIVFDDERVHRSTWAADSTPDVIDSSARKRESSTSVLALTTSEIRARSKLTFA